MWNNKNGMVKNMALIVEVSEATGSAGTYKCYKLVFLCLEKKGWSYDKDIRF